MLLPPMRSPVLVRASMASPLLTVGAGMAVIRMARLSP